MAIKFALIYGPTDKLIAIHFSPTGWKRGTWGEEPWRFVFPIVQKCFNYFPPTDSMRWFLYLSLCVGGWMKFGEFAEFNKNIKERENPRVTRITSSLPMGLCPRNSPIKSLISCQLFPSPVYYLVGISLTISRKSIIPTRTAAPFFSSPSLLEDGARGNPNKLPSVVGGRLKKSSSCPSLE